MESAARAEAAHDYSWPATSDRGCCARDRRRSRENAYHQCGQLIAGRSVGRAIRSDAALAKQTQNPVGGLVSLPFQFTFNSAGDLEDGT
jgi:hypothetical protein